MISNRFKLFYAALFFTAFMPYLPSVMPFLPGQIFGFNLTGWAWISMLLITLINLPYTKRISFPIWAWLPWMAYLFVYIVVEYSFYGLQLTLQYVLPILAGVVASGFDYREIHLRWLSKSFFILTGAVTLLSLGYLILFGWAPAMASTPMLLSIGAVLILTFYFISKQRKYLFYFGVLFLVPFLSVTRMGLAVFLAIFVLHFANRKWKTKVVYGFVGLLLALVVFLSPGFQEKTFWEGSGSLSDISFDYYENPTINNSGRSSWKMALESGLKQNPFWGNGPRADAASLGQVIGQDHGEAHNDYLSVRYNYGFIGLALLLFGFGITCLFCWRILRNSRNYWLFIPSSSVLTLFIAFAMFMYSDNILKYTITFPNLFFAIIGLVGSIYKFVPKQTVVKAGSKF